MASSSSSLTELCNVYLQRCVEGARVRQHWELRLGATLWVSGHLSLQDYSLLKSEPALVRQLYPDSKGDLETALATLQANMDKQRLPFRSFCHLACRHGTLERDLPELLQFINASTSPRLATLNKTILISDLMRFDHSEVFLSLLPGLTEDEKIFSLGHAFYYRRFELVEVLVNAPHNMQPHFSFIINGGRVEDLARFGFEEHLLDDDRDWGELLSNSTPAMFDRWYDAVKDRMDPKALSRCLKELVAGAIDKERLEMLEHLEKAHPDLLSQYLAVSMETNYDLFVNLGSLIKGGNERLLKLIFRCLVRYETQ